MTLYFIIFGNLIGRRIGTMDGFDYMQYIAPGLIMMSVITNSYGNVVSSFFGAKFGRHIEEMLVSPMSNATIILGHVAGGVLRGVLVGLLVTVVALFFTRLEVSIRSLRFRLCCCRRLYLRWPASSTPCLRRNLTTYPSFQRLC